MQEYAICPICQARIIPGNSSIAPREKMGNDLHNQEARIWVQARQMAPSLPSFWLTHAYMLNNPRIEVKLMGDAKAITMTWKLE